MDLIVTALPLILAAAITGALGLVSQKRALPLAWSATVFVVAAATNAFLNGLQPAAISAGVAILVLGVLIFTRVLNRSNTFAVPALFALLPIDLWWAFIPGLVLMLIISIVGLTRHRGFSDVKTTLLHAALITHSNGVTQAAPELVDEHVADERPTLRVNVLLVLGAGFLISAAGQVAAQLLVH